MSFDFAVVSNDPPAPVAATAETPPARRARRPKRVAALAGLALFLVAGLIASFFHLGRPERFWHLIPGIGKFNFPGSMLSWDVIVLNGYLALNIYICGYLLYCRYQKKMPAKWFYVPFVFIAICMPRAFMSAMRSRSA